ncbi:MAG: glycosyl hydrolase family 28-related protein, partial [Planctomycetota bacterium]
MPRPLVIDEDVQIPENVALRFQAQGRLVVASGVTVSLAGGVMADADQWIFDLADETSTLLAPGLVTVHPHWFGARGDGVTNDTTAMQQVAAFVNRRGGGRIDLAPGTYVVGRQELAGCVGRGFAWRPEPILRLEGNTSPVVVCGSGATLRAAPGLRLGSFDPSTGQPISTSPGFTDANYRADATWGLIELLGNASAC